jgi:hypothetical protein
MYSLALPEDGLDERNIPRYSNFMLSNRELIKEIEGSNRYESEVARKQREWLK